MSQKKIKYCTTNTIQKRSIEKLSIDRFVFLSPFLTIKVWGSILLISFTACGEPDIKLTREDRRVIDTLVNNQLDSISPILDSLCIERKVLLIENAVDSIMQERKKKEERLRLNLSQ